MPDGVYRTTYRSLPTGEAILKNEYDAAGKLSEQTTYEYDSDRMLKKTVITDCIANTDKTVTFAYDALKCRHQKGTT